MEKFLTEETPAKVMSLLAVALTSLMFLFMVSASNFGENTLPDPLTPPSVMSMLDNVSNRYVFAVQNGLITPTKISYAIGADNLAWIGNNAGSVILAKFGIAADDNTPVMVAIHHVHPTVAGASIQKTITKTATGFSMNVTQSP